MPLKYLVTVLLTVVPVSDTYRLTSPVIRTRCSRQALARGEGGTRGRTCNPLPGSFGNSARPALRPVCEKHRCTAAGRFAGNARLRAPVKEARNWSWVVAFGRLSQSRGGTPIDVRTPMGARPSPQARSNYPLRLSAFRLRISFVLPVRSVRQSMPKRSSHGAIHRRSPAGLQHGPPAQASETTPFCERLCPVVTRKRQWLGIARALSRAARTMRLIRPREAGEGA